MLLRSGALVAAAFFTFLAASLVEAADPAIAAAPAFTAQQLLAPPRAAWVTNGGTLYNQRYSPLSLIDRDNVKGTGGHGGGPTLIGKLDAAQMRLVTTTGRNNIPTFKDVYDVKQIRDVSEYIITILPKAAGAPK